MKLPRPDSIASVLFIALLASLCFNVSVGIENYKLKHDHTRFYDGVEIGMGIKAYQSWSKPLTKDELKALDLKLRQEVITFREGERVVYLPTMQTAIVIDFATQLRGRGYQTALIQFEKSIETKTVSAFDLIKIGEDYVEPKKLNLGKASGMIYYSTPEPCVGEGGLIWQ